MGESGRARDQYRSLEEEQLRRMVAQREIRRKTMILDGELGAWKTPVVLRMEELGFRVKETYFEIWRERRRK